MAHNIVDDDEFTTPIVVPDGTDSRNNAAEVVEAIAQGLANRTFSLLTHGAFIDSANHFTDGNTFDDVITAISGVEASNPSASSPALKQVTTAADDPAPGNKWKLVMQAELAGAATNASLWSGTLTGGEGQLMITLNADWDPSDQTWHQSDAAHASLGMLLHMDGKIAAFLAKPAAEAPWALWTTAGGTVVRAAEGNFDDVLALNDMTVDTGDFLFSAARNEPRPIRLAMGLDMSVLAPGPATFVNHQWVVPDTALVEIPIEAPIGGTLDITEVILGNTSGGNLTYTANLVQISNANWTTGAGPTYTTVDTATAVINNGTSVVVQLDWGGLAVSDNHTHVLQIAAAPGAAGAFVVRAARFFADRVGPSRN